MKTSRKFMLGLLITSVVIAIVGVAFYTIKTNTQTQSIATLAERLNQRGVPVKSISVLSKEPFSIEIIIGSSGNSVDDLWFAQLARREISLAYRIGIDIDSYKLVLSNSKGEAISWEENYLYQDDPYRKITLEPLKVNDKAVQDLIIRQLDLYGMSLDSIIVTSNPKIGDYDQFLTIQLSVQDIETANKSLSPFVLSLRSKVDDINSQYGARIVIYRVKLVDNKGNVLLSYVWDVETREETSSIAEGITPWYPQPRYAVPTTDVAIPTLPAYPPPMDNPLPKATTSPYP